MKYDRNNERVSRPKQLGMAERQSERIVHIR